MDLLTSYLITVPVKNKSADEVTMAYLRKVLPISLCSMYILQNNGTEFRNKQLIDTFKSLGVKPIYSSPYTLTTMENLKTPIIFKAFNCKVPT